MSDSLELMLNGLQSEIARIKATAKDPRLAQIAKMRAELDGIDTPAAHAALSKLQQAEAQILRGARSDEDNSHRPRTTKANCALVLRLLATANNGKPGHLSVAQVMAKGNLTKSEAHTAKNILRDEGRIVVKDAHDEVSGRPCNVLYDLRAVRG